MESARTALRVLLFLLAVGSPVYAPTAMAQPPLLPAQPNLTLGERSRLAEGARDSALAPWQREFMLGMARGEFDGEAPHDPPAFRAGLPRPDGTAADDGAWLAIPPPAARTEHTAIYDPVRERMVVLGGYADNRYVKDVWALSLTGSPAWNAPAPGGSPPSGRPVLTAIYDPVRDRMVVFWGGFNNRM